MIRIVLVAWWFSFAFSALGQTQPNPFDLHYRPPKTKTSSKPITTNPGIDSSTIKTPVFKKDKVNPPDLIQKSVKDTSDIREDSSLSKEGDNPFELEEGAIQDSTALSIGKTDAVIQNESKVTLPVRPGKPSSKGIQIFFLLLSLLFLIFIVNVERNFVKDLWRVISNENYSSLHLRNQRNTMRQILIMMGYMIFVIQAGIFFYHVLIVFNYPGRILDNIWTCMAFVLVIYVIRHAVIRYLRWLFNNEREMTLFGFDISIFNIMVGLVLLPINILLNFGPESLTKPLIITGLIIVAVAYLMRQLRWMLTARQLIANSLFLFFVYLCAVEILPLWAISKFFW